MTLSQNSDEYAYCVTGPADDRSGPALGGTDSLKPETFRPKGFSNRV